MRDRAFGYKVGGPCSLVSSGRYMPCFGYGHLVKNQVSSHIPLIGENNRNLVLGQSGTRKVGLAYPPILGIYIGLVTALPARLQRKALPELTPVVECKDVPGNSNRLVMYIKSYSADWLACLRRVRSIGASMEQEAQNLCSPRAYTITSAVTVWAYHTIAPEGV